MVGYGQSGDGVNGFTLPSDFSVKRFGSNITEFGFGDDDINRFLAEGFLYDFDGPDLSTNRFGPPKFNARYGEYSTATLGNDVESTVASGDSGGPAFILNARGELAVFGVNTVGFGGGIHGPGTFGSVAGGMIVQPCSSWIDSVVGGAHSGNSPGQRSGWLAANLLWAESRRGVAPRM